MLLVGNERSLPSIAFLLRCQAGDDHRVRNVAVVASGYAPPLSRHISGHVLGVALANHGSIRASMLSPPHRFRPCNEGLTKVGTVAHNSVTF